MYIWVNTSHTRFGDADSGFSGMFESQAEEPETDAMNFNRLFSGKPHGRITDRRSGSSACNNN
jgi:hypothetical protein